MGLSKDLLIKKEESRQEAINVLKELKIIDVCEGCGYYTSLEDLTPDVYALATNMVKRKDNFPIDDIKLFHEAIKEIYDECGVETLEQHIEDCH